MDTLGQLSDLVPPEKLQMVTIVLAFIFATYQKSLIARDFHEKKLTNVRSTTFGGGRRSSVEIAPFPERTEVVCSRPDVPQHGKDDGAPLLYISSCSNS